MGDPQPRPNEAIDFQGIDLAEIDLELDEKPRAKSRARTGKNRPFTLAFLLIGIALVKFRTHTSTKPPTILRLCFSGFASWDLS